MNKLLSSILICFLMISANYCAADTNPKTTRILVGFSGGSTERLARILANKLSEQTGNPVVVDIRLGAAGKIADDIVNKAPGDGSVLGIGSNSNFFIIPAWDAKKNNREPVWPQIVNTTAITHHLIVANPSLPIQNLRELIRLAKRNPEMINIGTNGIGGIKHLILDQICQLSDTKFNHIPYKTVSGFIFDTVAGRIDGSIVSYESTITGLLRQKKLKAIATLYQQRIDSLPNIPTAREQGLNISEPVYWGITIPLATTPSVAKIIKDQVNKILSTKEFGNEVVKIGLTPFVQPLEGELNRLVESDRARWNKIISISNFELDQ